MKPQRKTYPETINFFSSLRPGNVDARDKTETDKNPSTGDQQPTAPKVCAASSSTSVPQVPKQRQFRVLKHSTEVFMAVAMMNAVSWNVMPHGF